MKTKDLEPDVAARVYTNVLFYGDTTIKSFLNDTLSKEELVQIAGSAPVKKERR